MKRLMPGWFHGRGRRALQFIAFNLAGLLLLLVLVEGAASWLVFVHRVRQARPMARVGYTRHDDLLGWSSIPGASVPNLYGPGIGVTIGPQGFRGPGDYAPEAPAGRVRIVCSGDSFTFGYGVADGDTWCHQLQARDARYETLNLGQGGYGLDQAYLWYRRDALRFAHQVQILAFITVDFARMGRDRFAGYPKPRLELAAGELSVRNVPVPRRSDLAPWLARNRSAIEGLFTVHVARKLFAGDTDPAPGREVRPVVRRVLQELAQLHAQRRSQLILVYLPDGTSGSDKTLEWRRYLGSVAAEIEVSYLDLAGHFDALDPQQRDGLFLGRGALEYAEAAGHYTAAGNVLVAQALLDRLDKLPAVQDRLRAAAGATAER